MPEESKKAKGRGGRSFTPLYERRRQAKLQRVAAESAQTPTQAAPAASHARPSGGRLFSRKGAAVAGVAAAGVGGAAYLAHRAQRRKSNTVAKLYDPFTGEYVEVEKSEPVTNRDIWLGDHTRKGKSKAQRRAYYRAGVKARFHDPSSLALAAGGAVGGAYAGEHLGRRVGGLRGEVIGASLGAGAGVAPGAHRAHKRSIPVSRAAMAQVGKAAYPVAWPPPRSTGLQARTPQGKFVSHANDLKVVHYHPKRNPTSKLVQIKHGPRSVSGSSVGKSLGSGAVKIGSRITGA